MDKKETNELKTKDKVIGIAGIIFILILVLIVRVSPNESKTPIKDGSNQIDSEENNNNDNNKDDADKINDNYFKLIDEKNYDYTFTININDEKEILTGSVYQDKNKFTLISNTSEKYLIISDNYLKLENNQYISVDNIREYLKYIDINNIKNIINLSVGKMEDNIITYEVSVFDLLDEFENIEYNSFDEIENDKIKVTLEDNMIKEIEINYSNYYKYLDKNNKQLEFKLEFKNYGRVENFDI